MRFNEVRQIFYVLRTERREILLIRSSAQIQTKLQYHSTYNQRIYEEGKKKTKTSEIRLELKSESK